jgi:hypothetical protein
MIHGRSGVEEAGPLPQAGGLLDVKTLDQPQQRKTPQYLMLLDPICCAY